MDGRAVAGGWLPWRCPPTTVVGFGSPNEREYRGPPLTGKDPAITPWRRIETVTRQLELCGARAGETAMVLSTDTDDVELRSLFALALERLGCRVSELVVRSGALLDGTDPVDNEAVVAALLHSDLVVDMSGSLVEQSSAREEILDEARTLTVQVTSPAQLDHLVAHPGLKQRLDRAHDILTLGSTLRLSSVAGTNLDAAIDSAAVDASAGVASHVGESAAWPAGIVWVAPDECAGCVIAMPGDILFEAGHVLRSPVRLEIQRGRVIEVLGDTADADVMRALLESLQADAAYVVNGIGWGMNLARRTNSLGRFDPDRVAPGRGPLTAGSVNIRTGNAGGPTFTLCLSDATATVDDVDLVAAGGLDGIIAPDIYERAAAD